MFFTVIIRYVMGLWGWCMVLILHPILVIDMNQKFTYTLGKKLFSTLFLSLLFIVHVLAAGPKIVSFSPANGPVGTVVTITGTDFNATSANNIVYFGAAKATVTSSTDISLTVTVPVGATYAPISVTDPTTGLGGYSANPFKVMFSNGPINMDTKSDFYTSGYANDIALGDLDGDGKLDMVCAKGYDNGLPAMVSIFRNTSTSGAFTATSFAPRVDLTTGLNALSVAIRDLDGDGKLDIAVVNNRSNSVSVFRNISTSGSLTASSFAPKVDFATNAMPVSIAIGDLDGDGKQDLVIVNNSASSVSILRNTSTVGAINSTSFTNRVDFAAGTDPQNVAIGNLAGSDLLDIAITNGTTGRVSVLINTSVGGPFTAASFAPKVDFTTGAYPKDVVIGDFDGDGKSDLAVTNAGVNLKTLSVLRNTTPSNPAAVATFGSKVDFETSTAPNGIITGDLNGDGKLDLVVTNKDINTLSVYRNTALSGSITVNSFAHQINFTTGPNPVKVAMGDLDGDGKPDLATANYFGESVSVLRNIPYMARTITTFTPASGPVGTVVTISGDNFNSIAANNTVYFGATKATVTAATATTLKVVVPSGATYKPISILNNSTGFTSYTMMPFVPTYTPPKNRIIAADFDPAVNFTNGKNNKEVAIGDLDGDGKPDLVGIQIGVTTISIYRNTSEIGAIKATSFAEPLNLTLNGIPEQVVISDLDGDGKPDIIVACSSTNKTFILRNTSVSGLLTASSFASPVELSRGANYIAVDDLDGDGKPDLVFAGRNSGNGIFRNTSVKGSITSTSFTLQVSLYVQDDPSAVAIADLDSDGKPDIVICSLGNGPLAVFKNTSEIGILNSNSFAPRMEYGMALASNLAIADIDGDGKLDIVTAASSSNSLSVYRNTSVTGTLSASSFGSMVRFSTVNYTDQLAPGDLDGDGKVDLIIGGGQTGFLSLLRNISVPGSITAASFDPKIDLNVPVGLLGVTVGDLDGDGNPDLVSAVPGSISVIRNSRSFPGVINSFSPMKGAAGSTVTITGKNFNAIAANNVVFFGATKATVTSSSTTSLTVVVPLGTTYEHISVTDLSTALTTYSSKPFNLTNPNGAVNPETRQNFKANRSLNLIKVADIDGDSMPDIVALSSTTNSLSVFHNTSASGYITSASFASPINFATGVSPSKLVVGDIDGDGKLDLAVTNNADATVSIFRNTAVIGSITAASFAAKIDFATGQSPVGLALGDLDGDGKPDLAVANSNNNNVSIFYNTSVKNSTTPSFAARINFASGQQPYHLAIGDLDGDGKPELAVANSGSNNVSVFYNTSTAGSITATSFAGKVDFATGSSPYSVAIGDLDGDDKLDLATANNNSLSILRNLSTVGSITTSSFADKVDVTLSNNASQVVISDVNGDGKPDLSAVQGGTLSTFRNISIVGAITSASFASKEDITSGDALSLAICDIDGDGLPDFISNNAEDVLVFRNQQYTPVITSFSPESGQVGTSVTVTGTNFNPVAASNAVFFGATRATVISATATSLNVAVPVSASYQNISVTNLNSALTAYSAKPFNVTYENGSIGAQPKLDLSAYNQPYGVAAGDLNGDGKPDLVAASTVSTAVRIFQNSFAGNTSDPNALKAIDLFTDRVAYNLALGDLNGDGKLDLVVVNKANFVTIYQNTHLGGIMNASPFTTKFDLVTGNSPVSVAIGDLDGDGKPDLAVANKDSRTVSVFRNISSNGTIQSGAFMDKVDFLTGESPQKVAISDIDGDGKADLIIANTNDNSISVLHNNSLSGAINANSFSGKIDFVTGTLPVSVAVGDLDGDGKPDLAVANSSNNTVSVLKNTSTIGEISATSFAEKVDFATSTLPSSVSIGDLNGDGKPDLAITNTTSNTISVLRNASATGLITATSFSDKTDFQTGDKPAQLAIVDLDGDGQSDLISTNTNSSTISVIINRLLPPAITSFSPTSGPIGTTVTLTGANFNSALTNNIVFFGATKATVTAATKTSLTVTVPISATYQNISVTDLASRLTGYAAQPFNATYQNGIISTLPKQDFTAGTKPYEVAVGDLDGDGKPDVVVSNQNSNSISIYRNTSASGSITATSFAPKVDYPSSLQPQGLAIGDMNGDGKPEIIVANYGSNTVSVRLNNSVLGSITSGSFPVIDLPAGIGPTDVAIGDLDGDGKPDIAVTNTNNNTVSLYRNKLVINGFAPSFFASKIDFVTGINPRSVAIGDLDGDGKPELAIANRGSNTVSVYRNTAVQDAITTTSFANKVDCATGGAAYDVVMADFDGDGKPDLALANSGSNTVSILQNQSVAGTITAASFASKVDIATGTEPRTLAVGDLDGDGKPDITVTNYTANTVSVLRNISSNGPINVGSFAQKLDFIAGTQPQSVVIADIDGDNRNDLVVANFNSNSLSVIRSDAFAPAITSFSPTSGPTGTTVTLTGTNFNVTPEKNIVFFGATKATVTASSTTSLTVTVPVGATYQPISVLNSASTLTGYSAMPFATIFTPVKDDFTAADLAFKVDLPAGNNPANVAIGDLDGDGKADIAVVNSNSNTVSVYRNVAVTGSVSLSSFASKVDFATGSNPQSITIGDLDGDGKADLAIVNANSNTLSVYKNTSTSGALTASSFLGKVDFITGEFPKSVAIGDLDGDGKPDLAVANANGNTISIYKNIAISGAITTSSFAAKSDFATGTQPYHIAIADIDGDKKPDLGVVNNNSNTVSIYLNTSTLGTIATNSFAGKVDFATGNKPMGLVIADLNGDGKADLAVANQDSNTLSIYQNTSTSGSITNGSFATKVDFASAAQPSGLAIGDLTGDGKPDLVLVTANSNTASIFRNASNVGVFSTSSFAAKVDVQTGTKPVSLAIGDLDGDGKPDLALTNLSGNTISILRNSGVPTITSFSPVVGQIGSTVTITGKNFNPDGISNVVFFGATKATIVSSSPTSLSVKVPAGANYQNISITDINNGLTAYSVKPFIISYLDGTIGTQPKQDLANVAQPHSVATGDLDGDGKPDLVVANSSGNTLSIYPNASLGGSATASSFADKIDFITGASPSGVAIGDLNGDGKLDISVANAADNTVSVFQNTSVTGSITKSSFANKIDLPTGAGPRSLAIGDLDNDGRVDLAVANSAGNTVSVIHNLSTNSLLNTDSFRPKVDFVTGNLPNSVAIGDLDGDGKFDLAVANNASNTVSVLRNTSAIGVISSASFASKIDFTSGAQPYSVAIGDLDGDGKADFAVANNTSNTVSVLLNTSAIGNITTASFAAKVDFATGSKPSGLAIGDMDGDGKADLVLSNSASNTVSLLRSEATSGVINAASFAIKFDLATGMQPVSVLIGDLDGDGKLDLATANLSDNTISILRNGSIPTITSFSPQNGPIGTTVTITGTGFNLVSTNNVVFFGATRATIVSANSTQIAVKVPAGATLENISVTNLLSGLTAYSVKPFDVIYANGSVNAQANQDFKGVTPSAIVVSDLNGDGKPDLAVVNKEAKLISLYRNTSTVGSITAASFADKVDFATGYRNTSITAKDLDGDGKPDLIVTNPDVNSLSIFKNTSIGGDFTTSTLAPKVEIATGLIPVYVAVSDLNGDGKPDLAVSSSLSNAISVHQNIGIRAAITTASFAPKVDFATGTRPACLVIGDLDGDGKPELAVANVKSNSISILRNTSPIGSITTESFAAKVDLAVGSTPLELVMADFDGDSKLDLAVNNTLAATVSIFKNTAVSGIINSTSFANVFNLAVEYAPQGLSIGDIDGDGKIDISVSYPKKLAIFRNTSQNGAGTASFAAQTDIIPTSDIVSTAIGDLDGDGKPDFITNGSTFISIYRTIGVPVITSFSPTIAYTGSRIAINGANLTGTTAVRISNNPVTSFTVVSDSLITAIVGQSNSGNLSITTPRRVVSVPGYTDITLSRFTYQKQSTFQVNTQITTLSRQSTIGGPMPETVFGAVTTIAGRGNKSLFPGILGICTDYPGNIYVSGIDNVIKKITPEGVVTTIAGSGSQGAANGPAAQASFNRPIGLAADAGGNIYIADSRNNLIRKISTGGVVSTFAGSGVAGAANGTGTAASFNGPQGLTIDAADNIYVADTYNNLIRKITPEGVVSTFSGSGVKGTSDGSETPVSLNEPREIVCTDGVINAVDFENNVIREVRSGGLTLSIPVAAPQNIAGQTIFSRYRYVGGNNKIRRIDNSKVVIDFAGSGVAGDEDGVGAEASFNGPTYLATDLYGNLYVGDSQNGLIRKISLTGFTISPALPEGLKFDSATGQISGTPTVVSANTEYTVTGYNYAGLWGAKFNIQVQGGAAVTTTGTLSALTTTYGQVSSSSEFKVEGTTLAEGILVTPPAGFEVSKDNITFNSTLTIGAAGYTAPTTVYVRLSANSSAGSYAGNIVLTSAGAPTFNQQIPASNVSPAALLYAASPATKVYGDVNPTLSGTITGFVGTDTQASATSGTMNFITTATANSIVGSYEITGSGITPNENYTITQATANATALTITKKAVTVTAEAKYKEFGQLDPTLTYQVNVGTLVGADTFTGQLVRDAGETIGSYAIKQGTVSMNANYAITYNGANLTIQPRAITVAAIAKNKTYGDADPALMYNIVSGTLLGNDAFTGALIRDAGENAGIYTIKQGSLTLNSSYLLTYVSAEFNIDKATLVVSANLKAKLYGEVNPPLTVTYNGFQNGDLVSSLTTQAIATTNATQTSSVGNYVITPSSAVSNNYRFIYINGILQIVPGNRAINFSPLAVATYGDADLSPSATSTSGETITYIVSNPNVAIVVNGKLHIVGAGTTMVTAYLPANANYSQIPSVSQTLVVNKASQQISFGSIPALARLTGVFDLSTVTSTSNLPITFAVANPLVASVTGTNLKGNRIGVTTITATQPGNANYLEATAVTQAVTVADVVEGREIIVHQAISPNGDGINDVLYIEGIDQHPENRVSIVNRNGVKIFEMSGYNNTTKAFDGHSNKTGDMQQRGTYFYVAEYGGKRKIGWFILKY
jgi:gliding motility-associated-like protein